MDNLQQFVSGDRYFTPAEVTDPASKKRKSELPAVSPPTIKDRILKIEEELITIHVKLEELSAKSNKPARKNTLSELNLKLSAVLDILSTNSDGKVLFGY
jgi:hypothetical protein